MKEAEFYIKKDNMYVKCYLCPHNCIIINGGKGICNVRENRDGVLYALTYERVSSIALDPIQKKPLNFFRHGTYILSVGTYGCNFKCDFCQNYHISQRKPELERITSDDLCATAMNIKKNIGIAFTYNEPFIWYEYVLETSIKNRKNGMVNVLVTNGYVNPEPLKKLLPYIDAMNIDIKFFNEKYYRDICKGKLEIVKNTIKECSGRCHIELTNMSVPGVNDSIEEMDEMCRWIASVDENIPLHIIPFRPMYKMMDLQRQSFNKILSLKETALKYLKRVVI